jgi:hypothetical protein
MTVANLVPRKEVERVHASLQRTFLAECPEHEQMVEMDPPQFPFQPQKLGLLCFSGLYAWRGSARARFVRSANQAAKRGEHVTTPDGKLRDQPSGAFPRTTPTRRATRGASL